jgi:hypothetical protein
MIKAVLRSRAWLFPEGIPVTFTIVREASRRDPLALKATDIQSVFAGESGDLSTYWEVGQVVKTFGERQFAFVKRPDEDQIYVGLKSIKPEFADRIPELRECDFAVYQVEQKAPGYWRATNTELFSREENNRLRRGLTLVEETTPVRVPEPEPVSVLAPEMKRSTIAEVIKRRLS